MRGPAEIHRLVGERALELDHLEREARGGGHGIGEHLGLAARAPASSSACCSRRAGRIRRSIAKAVPTCTPAAPASSACCSTLRPAVAAGQPEGHARASLIFSRSTHVALAVDRLAAVVQLQLAARRRVVSAGGGPFDDEAVDVAVGLLQHRERQDVGGDDRQEPRPRERRQRSPSMKSRGVKCIIASSPLLAPPTYSGYDGRLVVGAGVEHAGDLQRDAGAHQDVADAGQHGAVDGDQVRRLDLLEEVDADGIVVAFARQEHLHEVGDRSQTSASGRGHSWACVGRRVYGRLGRLAAGDEVGAPDALGHRAERERVEGAAHVPAGIAILQPPRQHLVEGGAGRRRRAGPSDETACASRQLEIPTPMPPWMIFGSVMLLYHRTVYARLRRQTARPAGAGRGRRSDARPSARARGAARRFSPAALQSGQQDAQARIRRGSPGAASCC